MLSESFLNFLNSFGPVLNTTGKKGATAIPCESAKVPYGLHDVDFIIRSAWPHGIIRTATTRQSCRRYCTYEKRVLQADSKTFYKQNLYRSVVSVSPCASVWDSSHHYTTNPHSINRTFNLYVVFTLALIGKRDTLLSTTFSETWKEPFSSFPLQGLCVHVSIYFSTPYHLRPFYPWLPSNFEKDIVWTKSVSGQAQCWWRPGPFAWGES